MCHFFSTFSIRMLWPFIHEWIWLCRYDFSSFNTMWRSLQSLKHQIYISSMRLPQSSQLQDSKRCLIPSKWIYPLRQVIARLTFAWNMSISTEPFSSVWPRLISLLLSINLARLSTFHSLSDPSMEEIVGTQCPRHRFPSVHCDDDILLMDSQLSCILVR